jgi:hypothetical protein
MPSNTMVANNIPITGSMMTRTMTIGRRNSCQNNRKEPRTSFFTAAGYLTHRTCEFNVIMACTTTTPLPREHSHVGHCSHQLQSQIL